MKMKQFQIAGIKSFTEAHALLKAGADMLGFPLRLPVHQPDVTEAEASKIISSTQSPDKCLLITYLSNADEISKLATELGVHNIQLHGDISTAELVKLKKLNPNYFIIKSIIIGPDTKIEDLKKALDEYSQSVDAFITDTFDPTTGASGATGKTHDWTLSQKVVELSSKPIILAGGLNADNVYKAILFVKPASVDTHTGVEDDQGNKDIELVARFVSEAKRAFSEIE